MSDSCVGVLWYVLRSGWHLQLKLPNTSHYKPCFQLLIALPNFNCWGQIIFFYAKCLSQAEFLAKFQLKWFSCFWELGDRRICHFPTLKKFSQPFGWEKTVKTFCNGCSARGAARGRSTVRAYAPTTKLSEIFFLSGTHCGGSSGLCCHRPLCAGIKGGATPPPLSSFLPEIRG